MLPYVLGENTYFPVAPPSPLSGKRREKGGSETFASDFTTAYLFVFLPFAIKSGNPKARMIREGGKGMECILEAPGRLGNPQGTQYSVLEFTSLATSESGR